MVPLPNQRMLWMSWFRRTSSGSTLGSFACTAPCGLPRGFCVAGGVRYAFVPRAVADAARWLTDIGDVRAVVAEAVQRRMCSIEHLVEELEHGPKQGSALLRRALAEVADGVRSAAEGQLHALIKRSGLPMPMFNPRLFVGRAFLAMPDCWWPEAGVAAEVDSRAWHLSPRGWENTLARQAHGRGRHYRAAFRAEPDLCATQRGGGHDPERFGRRPGPAAAASENLAGQMTTADRGDGA
jgi:hypothetical protein